MRIGGIRTNSVKHPYRSGNRLAVPVESHRPESKEPQSIRQYDLSAICHHRCGPASD